MDIKGKQNVYTISPPTTTTPLNQTTKPPPPPSTTITTTKNSLNSNTAVGIFLFINVHLCLHHFLYTSSIIMDIMAWCITNRRPNEQTHTIFILSSSSSSSLIFLTQRVVLYRMDQVVVLWNQRIHLTLWFELGVGGTNGGAIHLRLGYTYTVVSGACYDAAVDRVQ